MNNLYSPINVLLCSSGRRNYLVEYFKEALAPFGGKVHTMNSEKYASSLYVADNYSISPLIYSDEYESYLFEYCNKNEISIVIPLLDIELPILSKLKLRFLENGIRILVADKWLTKIANDKWETNHFLEQNGFNVLPCFLNLEDLKNHIGKEQITFPLFIKPRWGMASIGVYKADDLDELFVYYKKSQKEVRNSYLKYESQKDIENSVIIHSQLPGEEYGLDIINDLDGNYCNTLVKKKLKMFAGETEVAKLLDLPLLKDLGRKLSAITKHPGLMDVDVFFDGVKAFILDINPRFGGGYPFIHEAGVDLPKAIIYWHLGLPVDLNLLQCKTDIVVLKGFKMINLNMN